VVGATNRPDLLDSALTRPGRIDRKIYVGVPDFESRKSILKIGLRGRAVAKEVDVSELAEDSRTEGYSGAELVSLCREAALYAIEEDDAVGSGEPIIMMRHLMKALKEVKRQITPDIIQFYAEMNF